MAEMFWSFDIRILKLPALARRPRNKLLPLKIQVWARVSNFDLPAIARDLPAIAVCAGIAVVRRPWRWQAGAGT